MRLMINKDSNSVHYNVRHICNIYGPIRSMKREIYIEKIATLKP